MNYGDWREPLASTQRARRSPLYCPSSHCHGLALPEGSQKMRLFPLQLLQQRRIDSAPPLLVRRGQQADLTNAIIIPTVIVQNRIDADTLYGRARAQRVEYFGAHVVQPIRPCTSFRSSLRDQQWAPIALMDF